MKLWVKSGIVAILLSAFSLALPFKEIHQGFQSVVPLMGVAMAASTDYDDDEYWETEVVPDPLEGFNRAMFRFNDGFYFYALKPVSVVYAAYFPEGFRICIRNAFKNIFFPARAINNLLQGKVDRAGVEIARFVINSTLGVAGMWDIAYRDFKLKPYDEDFGQTLGHHGVKSGLYIVLPVFGPSTARDTVGLVADAFMNPLYYLSPDIYSSIGLRSGQIVNVTSLRIGEYEDFKASAIDPYVSMREAYHQYRAHEVLE